MNKKTLIISTLTLLVGLGSFAVTSVHADEGELELSFPHMIQRFTERFNLKEDEVKSFLGEQREERQAERQAYLNVRLSTAVSEGKITEDQKQLILDKIVENRESMEDRQDYSAEEWRENRENHQEEMQAWAQENGIDLTLLDLGKGPVGGQGAGIGGMGQREGKDMRW